MLGCQSRGSCASKGESAPAPHPSSASSADAAGIDPEAATLDRDRAAQRLRNYKSTARPLDQHGALRDGLTIDQAAAAIFTIGHPETCRTLVLDGNWDDRQWATWAQATLETALDARIAEEASAASLAWFRPLRGPAAGL